MASEIDPLPTLAKDAWEYVQRFKKNHPPRNTIETYVVYAVAALTDHVEEHFGSKLAEHLKGRFPEGSNGIRVYKGTELLGTRRHYLVFTYHNSDSPNPGIPEEMLDHVYRLKNVDFDLDVVAKLDKFDLATMSEPNKLELFNNHIVCQPDCPQGPSLFSDAL